MFALDLKMMTDDQCREAIDVLAVADAMMTGNDRIRGLVSGICAGHGFLHPGVKVSAMLINLLTAGDDPSQICNSFDIYRSLEHAQVKCVNCRHHFDPEGDCLDVLARPCKTCVHGSSCAFDRKDGMGTCTEHPEKYAKWLELVDAARPYRALCQMVRIHNNEAIP